MRTFRGNLLALALLAAIIPFGCAETPVTNDGTIDSYAEAKAAWEAHDAENYSFEFRLQCFCPNRGRWMRIMVRKNAVVAVTNLESGETYGPGTGFNGFDETIDDLFAHIGEAEAADPSKTTYIATYDSVYGYPKEVRIDWSKSAAVEESGFAIRTVEIE